MPQSTPLFRNPAFVFGPPILLGFLGTLLLIQGAFAGPRLDIIEQKLQSIEQSELIQPRAQLTDHSFPRVWMNSASSIFVLVNKHNPISPSNFTPTDLVEPKTSKSLDNSRDLKLSEPAADALEKMAADLHAQGQGKMFLNSAFRSFDYQQRLFASKTKEYGKTGALLRSARAGFSEHQTGLAADVSVPEQGCAIMACFGDTQAGKWIAGNAWKYGFIVRYEKTTQETTGYSYEPWHLRFVGLEVARLYSESGINTLEDLWGLPPAPDYLPEITESTSD